MTKVAEKIAAEIENRGPIPFARFMELALYCPVCGYYEKEGDKIGRRGDYQTSVSVGGLFGELLARQFAWWLAEPGRPAAGRRRRPVRHLVEAGAHRGDLARDILRWLARHQPELLGQIQYWIVEPSERRRKWQRTALADFGDSVRWARNVSEVGHSGAPVRPTRRTAAIDGIIFANELLDALPIHRFGWDARQRRWFEWGVTLNASQFVWSRLERPPKGRGLAPPTLERRFSVLADYLPDEFTVDVCPAASAWWRRAASALAQGRLMTIDYGFTAEELLVPERQHGTLRAYRRHQFSPDVLAEPGQQDLTAHVNFTAIEAAGQRAGLKTEAFVTQSQFLTRIVERASGGGPGLGEWTPSRVRQFQTLTHPEHLGRPFRVLVQARG